VANQIRATVRSFAAFTFRLFKVGVFPGALYLAPTPAEPFVALTAALARRFPEYPPYGGQFRNIVPHLTVAQAGGWQHSSAHTELLCALYPSGGILSQCSELVLTEDSSGRWETMCTFPLLASSNRHG